MAQRYNICLILLLNLLDPKIHKVENIKSLQLDGESFLKPIHNTPFQGNDFSITWKRCSLSTLTFPKPP